MNTSDLKNIYFIPGWGFRAHIFDNLTVPGFNKIYLDYYSESASSLDNLSTLLAKKMQDNAVVVGWSFGGLIALNIAVKFPDKIKKLVLLASQARFVADEHWPGIENNVADDFILQAKNNPEALKRKFISMVNYPNKSVEYKNVLKDNYVNDHSENMRSFLQMMFAADLRSKMKDINTDVLHIISEKDAVIKQDQNILRDLSDKVSVCCVGGVGHAGFLSDAERYKNIIERFVNNERNYN